MNTELEMFKKLQFHLQQAEECCRWLAHMRQDTRWILVGAKFGQGATMVHELFIARSVQEPPTVYR